MRLAIRHVTTYRYTPEVQSLALRLRLFPVETVQQRLVSWSVTVNGDAVGPLFRDALGEGEGLWFARRRGEVAEIVVEGAVETSDHTGVLGQFGRARPGVYLRDTDLTAPGEAVAAIAAEVEGDTPLARMHALNEAIQTGLDYRPGVTDAATTAEQAAALGAGVCQDFAHVFVAAARSMAIPARYVVGYLHDAEAPEAASHAWAEVHLQGLGWVGFDPVHEVCPAAHHVRLATGFDAADAAPIRGTHEPGVEEEMAVEVTIGPAGQSQKQGQGQSQGQSQG
ncbi:MAG: transglutaminase family protein [Pseudomonadota bacterium]